MIHYRRHYQIIVRIWFERIKCEVKNSRKLMLMHLANDVIQNSRNKGPEFGREFGKVLPKAFQHLRTSDGTTREKLNRLFTIWEERKVYHRRQIVEFKRAFSTATERIQELESPSRPQNDEKESFKQILKKPSRLIDDNKLLEIFGNFIEE
ncbi:regulation of nuclear pre-mRNA domain-containing protein 1B-like [Fopius arisanus]|uniref:Regulation of nuclear pre-mRNA domain-containing protein 1B-like n=1 Tax=Fopius arisanus TaxID=64838 RepID=A0A9R1TJ50_9HYME|nr:PREDICTED: regulation of nuclear pre-mRNA domain-containing protein 1B-like [Fopius arisanus]